MKDWITTRNKWKRFSKKFAAIGTAASILGTLLAIIFYFSENHDVELSNNDIRISDSFNQTNYYESELTHATAQTYSLDTDIRIPPVPPDIPAPILDITSQFSDCNLQENPSLVRLAKAGQDDYYATNAPSYFLIDERGVQERYYLSGDLAQVQINWLPTIMVPGRYLKIKAAVCGAGSGPLHLTYIESLARAP